MISDRQDEGRQAPPFTASLRDFRTLLALFITLRLVVLITLEPFSGATYYGDFYNLYRLAEITQLTGRLPFLGYWMEYPPLLVWLNLGLHQLIVVWCGMPPHTYYYALSLLALAADCGNLALIRRIGAHLYGPERGLDLAWAYALLGVPLVFISWHLDAITTLLMLAGLWALLQGREVRSALAIAGGILVKVMPGLLVPVVWRFRPPRRAALYTGMVGTLVILAYLPFLILSPAYTLASMRSQLSKSSWQTIWALIDGNFGTGNFGDLIDRLDPARAAVMLGHPPAVPAWIPLIVFGVLYIYLFTRPMLRTDRALVAFFGVTWCVFLLWSKGWSPQWMLMLIPLILLVFPQREGVMAVLAFSLLNLLEWPVLMSRGMFWGLYLTVPLRTLMLIGVLVAFFRQCRVERTALPGEETG